MLVTSVSDGVMKEGVSLINVGTMPVEGRSVPEGLVGRTPEEGIGKEVGSSIGVVLGRIVGMTEERDASMLEIMLPIGTDDTGKVPVGTMTLDTSDCISDATLDAMLETMLGRSGTEVGTSEATEETRLLTPDSITETALEICETRDGTIGIGMMPLGEEVTAVGPAVGFVKPKPDVGRGITPASDESTGLADGEIVSDVGI